MARFKRKRNTRLDQKETTPDITEDRVTDELADEGEDETTELVQDDPVMEDSVVVSEDDEVIIVEDNEVVETHEEDTIVVEDKDPSKDQVVTVVDKDNPAIEDDDDVDEDDDIDEDDDDDIDYYYEDDEYYYVEEEVEVAKRRPLIVRFFLGILTIIRNIVILVLVLGLLTGAFIFFSVFIGTINYPVEYSEIIDENAEKYSLDPQLIAAIIKTESGYDETAVSQVGARGLMQIMPDTAQWSAQQMGIEYKSEFLDDPEYNIEMGSFYIAYLINQFQNQDLAIAAYNTGASNVQAWIDDGTITWERDSLSAIPFQETRDYVVKVNRAKEVYDIFYADGLEQAENQNTFGLAFDNMLDLFRWARDSVMLENE